MLFAKRFCGFGKAKQKEARIYPKSLMTAVVWTTSHENLGTHNHLSLSKKMPLPEVPLPSLCNMRRGPRPQYLGLGWSGLPSKVGHWAQCHGEGWVHTLKETPSFRGFGEEDFFMVCKGFFLGAHVAVCQLFFFELFIEISGSGQFFGLLPMLFLENIWVIRAFFSDGDWNQANLNGISFFWESVSL